MNMWSTNVWPESSSTAPMLSPPLPPPVLQSFLVVRSANSVSRTSLEPLTSFPLPDDSYSSIIFFSCLLLEFWSQNSCVSHSSFLLLLQGSITLLCLEILTDYQIPRIKLVLYKLAPTCLSSPFPIANPTNLPFEQLWTTPRTDAVFSHHHTSEHVTAAAKNTLLLFPHLVLLILNLMRSPLESPILWFSSIE